MLHGMNVSYNRCSAYMLAFSRMIFNMNANITGCAPVPATRGWHRQAAKSLLHDKAWKSSPIMRMVRN